MLLVDSNVRVAATIWELERVPDGGIKELLRRDRGMTIDPERPTLGSKKQLLGLGPYGTGLAAEESLWVWQGRAEQ